MSLYDDLDTIKARTTEKVAGWSSGIKLLQSQLQLKKAAVTQPKREALRRSAQVSKNFRSECSLTKFITHIYLLITSSSLQGTICGERY